MKYVFRATVSLLALFCACSMCFSGNAHVQAAALVVPKANGKPLTGYSSPQFSSKQDAYIDNNGSVQELYIIAGNSWHIANLTYLTGAPRANGKTLVGFDSPQFQSKQYAYIDGRGHVEELYYTRGSSWHVADLSALAGAPVANGIALTGFDSPQFQSKQYAYVDTNGHMEELYVSAGNPWRFADLTTLTGASIANGLTLTGIDSPQFQSKQYAYVDTNAHIEELYIVAGNSWRAADLSAITGAVTASGFTLTGLSSPQFQSKQYAYLDTQGHVEELYVSSGNPWHYADLTNLTGAPLASGVTLTSLSSPQFQSKQYAYLDTNGHVEELYFSSGNTWHYADLTNLTSASVAYGLSLIGFDAPQFQSKQYVYVDSNRNVEELYYVQGTSWHVANLSAIV